MKNLRPAQTTAKRFGIGEWYGELIGPMAPENRRLLAQESLASGAVPSRLCPFRSDLDSPVLCSKKGGVCTLQEYTLDAGEIPRLVTICPSRFFDGNTVLKWISSEMLGVEQAIAVKEVKFLRPFLQSAGDAPDVLQVPKREGISRIARVLVHPDLSTLKWCAVEMQAVYFSGDNMATEFMKVAADPASDLSPAGRRRPDFRSSGPKRLMPQLQIKVPTLRRWGRKMAVVVDRSFHDALGNIKTAGDPSNADIAWFVVKYALEGSRARIVSDFVRYSTLEDSVVALTGGEPVSQSEFEDKIRAKLARQR